MTRPPSLFICAREIQDFFVAQGWEFCFIGGLSVIRWSRPRMTEDADLCLLTGFGDEETYVDALLKAFQPRFPNARQFSLINRVLPLNKSDGFQFDVSLGALQFEEDMVARASNFEFEPGAVLRTCSAEDLIVTKAVAGRPHDWKDIEGVLIRQRLQLDFDYIRRHLSVLCAALETDEPLQRLNDMIEIKHRHA